MHFDIDGARKAGYSDAEIADYLGAQRKFDVAAARQSGYRDDEILAHLSTPAAPAAPARTASPGFGTALAQALGIAPEETPEAADRRTLREQYDAETTTLGRLGTDFRRGTLRAGQSLVSAFSDLALELGMAQPAVQNTMAEQGLTPDQVRAAQPAVVARDVAGIEQQIRATPTRPIVGQVGAASTMGEAIGTLLEDPSGFIAGVGAESAGTNLPALLAALGTGPVGGAALIGGSSYINERQGGILQKLSERGVDTTDPAALAAALNDPVLLQEAIDYGQGRAEVIAPIDAATAGLGSKLLVPKVLQGPLGRVGTEVANVPAQMTVQAGAGALAETGAQVRTDGKVTAPGDILAEAVGEGFTAPLEVAGVGRTAIQERLRTKQRGEAVPSPAAPPPADAGAAPEAPTAPTPPPAPAKVLQGPLGGVMPPVPSSAPQAPAESVQTTLPAQQDPLAAGSDAPAPAPAAATPQPSALPETPDAIYQALDEATNLDADVAPVPDPDAARGSNAAVGADRGGVATPSRADAPPENAGTRISNRSLTRSPFERVFEEEGYTRDEATLLPDAVKVDTLRGALKKKFGLAEVEVDNTLNTQEAVDNMLDLHQNADAMLSVLGLPRSALSLGGRLRIRLYNRQSNAGVGNALAYARGNMLIGVRRRHSAFAHEFGHVLDYETQERIMGGIGGSALSGALAASKTGAAIRQQVESTKVGAAFYNLVRSMYRSPDEILKIRLLEHQIEKAREAVANARASKSPTRGLSAALGKLLRDRDKLLNVLSTSEKDGSFWQRLQPDKLPPRIRGMSDYLATPTEMIARTFEAYVSHKVEAELASRGLTEAAAQQGTQFLGLSDAQYRSSLDEFVRAVYPNTDERALIFQRFDEFVAAMREEGMLGAGTDPAMMPTDYGPLDPNRWHALTGKKEAASLRSVFRDELQALKNTRGEFVRLVRNARKLPSSQLGEAAKRLLQLFSAQVSTTMLSLKKKHANVPAIANIVNAFTYTPGKAEGVGTVFERARNEELNKFQNRLGKIVETFGGRKLTASEWTSVRDLLAMPYEFAVERATSGRDLNALPVNTVDREGRPVPRPIVQMASEIRRLLVDAYYYQTNAGVDLGFVRTGYFPRITDLEAAIEDPQGFRQSAEELYTLIRNREFDTAMEKIQKALPALGPLDTKGTVVGEITAALAQMRTAFESFDKKEMRKLMREVVAKLRALQPAPGDQYTLEQVKALQEISGALAEIRDAFRLDPEAQAKDWYHELVYGDLWDYEGRFPGSRFEKKRVLPPETDDIMRDYLVTNPLDALPIYFTKAASLAEFTRRFGKQGKKLTAWLKEAARAGVPPQDMELLADMVKITLGRPHGMSNKIRTTFAWVEAVMTWTLLARVLVTSLPEVGAIGMRSGNAGDIARATYTWIEATASRMREIVGKDPIKRAHAIEELATFLGTVSDATIDAVTQARYMGDTQMSTERLARWSSQYYARIGIHALTRAQRKAALSVGWKYMHRIARKFREGTDAERKTAAVLFADLGVAQAQMRPFVDFVLSTGSIPLVEQIENSGLAGTVQQALNRFVDEAIQNPTRVDKTYLANMQMPLLSASFSLLSFAYSFGKNIILGTTRRGATLLKGAGKEQAAIYAGGLAFAFANAYLLHVALTVARESMLNPERWDRDFKDEKGEILWSKVFLLSASRMGLAGPVDPVFQYFTNLKYDSSITNIVSGPVYGSMATNVDRIAGLAGRNSENSNTAEWNAARGAFDLFGAPTLSIITAAAPVGPVVGTGLGVLNAVGTSGAARTATVDAVVGEKDSRKKDKAPTQPGMIQ